ncbi:MAG: hypothetical protein H6713_25815 [Myxococcales bacterium]|nr:hypothetical protein [Myxococcales bacterium]
MTTDATTGHPDTTGSTGATDSDSLGTIPPYAGAAPDDDPDAPAPDAEPPGAYSKP